MQGGVHSEELDPLAVVHGDDLCLAVRLQRLQRPQQHPLFKTVEFWEKRTFSV